MMNDPADQQEQTIAKIEQVSAEDMKSASQYLLPERGLTLLVGDAAVISEPLKAAGFDVTLVEIPK